MSKHLSLSYNVLLFLKFPSEGFSPTTATYPMSSSLFQISSFFAENVVDVVKSMIPVTMTVTLLPFLNCLSRTVDKTRLATEER